MLLWKKKSQRKHFLNPSSSRGNRLEGGRNLHNYPTLFGNHGNVSAQQRAIFISHIHQEGKTVKPICAFLLHETLHSHQPFCPLISYSSRERSGLCRDWKWAQFAIFNEKINAPVIPVAWRYDLLSAMARITVNWQLGAHGGKLHEMKIKTCWKSH